jgi:hypothetical protein
MDAQLFSVTDKLPEIALVQIARLKAALKVRARIAPRPTQKTPVPRPLLERAAPPRWDARLSSMANLFLRPHQKNPVGGSSPGE